MYKVNISFVLLFLLLFNRWQLFCSSSMLFLVEVFYGASTSRIVFDYSPKLPLFISFFARFWCLSLCWSHIFLSRLFFLCLLGCCCTTEIKYKFLKIPNAYIFLLWFIPFILYIFLKILWSVRRNYTGGLIQAIRIWEDNTFQLHLVRKVCSHFLITRILIYLGVSFYVCCLVGFQCLANPLGSQVAKQQGSSLGSWW